MHISNIIKEFVKRVIKNNHQFEEMDRIYLCNQVLALIGEETFPIIEADPSVSKASTLELLDGLVNQGVANQVVEDFQSSREILESQLMNLLTPTPSQVKEKEISFVITRNVR